MKEISRKMAGVSAFIVGLFACLILPTILYIQSKTGEAQQNFSHSNGDFNEVTYWQNIRSVILQSLFPSILIIFIAGLIVLSMFRGWKKLFGVALILFSIVTLFLSIPAT